jgi:hypothetical protein
MNIRSNPDTTVPAVTTGPLPSSRKIFATPDAASDLRVPLREIILSEGAGEPNLPVYDTSGPYTDPSVVIDVNKGLARQRKTTAMSARRTPPRPSPRITSRCAASTATRSPNLSLPARASSPRR